MKKFLGAFFLLLATLGIYTYFFTGKQFSYDSYSPTASAHYAGQVAGAVVTIAMYVFSAVFFFMFDGIYKKDYLKGFATRKTQSILIMVLFVFFAIPGIISAFNLFHSLGSLTGSGISFFEFIWAIIIICIPSIIPMLIFALLADVYYLPYRLSKKLYINNDKAKNEYLSDSAEYISYSQDNFVLANDKVLFLPKFFCVIPHIQILRINSSLPWLTVIELTNGKKFKLYTKHCEDIKAAVKAHKKA